MTDELQLLKAELYSHLLGHIAQNDELEAALAEAKVLLKEVNGWHSDPESAEFNDCSVAPCDWCKRALELMKEK